MTAMNATVKDVMTAEVVAVRRDTTFKELAAALRQHRISAFPVVDDHQKVIGVVSEADMLAKEAMAEPGVVAELLHHSRSEERRVGKECRAPWSPRIEEQTDAARRPTSPGRRARTRP